MPAFRSSLGNSRARREPSVVIAACACATVTPGRRRALTMNAGSETPRSNIRGGAEFSVTSVLSGIQKSVWAPKFIDAA